jgi:hypothetical protein
MTNPKSLTEMIIQRLALRGVSRQQIPEEALYLYDNLLSQSEAARIARISRQAISALVARGKIDRHKVFGPLWVWRFEVTNGVRFSYSPIHPILRPMFRSDYSAYRFYYRSARTSETTGIESLRRCRLTFYH